MLDAVARFRFEDEHLAFLHRMLDPRTLDWLAGYRFRGDIDGYPEGELYFPGSPAHAFSLLHEHEADAFAAQVAALGPDTTLLVDTYDITQGIATAIEVAGPGLRAIRIDSGEHGELARQARDLLDDGTGTAVEEVVFHHDQVPALRPHDRLLPEPLLREGQPVGCLPTLHDARERVATALTHPPI